MVGLKCLNSIGLVLDIIGVVILGIYSSKTFGMTTEAEVKYYGLFWIPKIGYSLIGLGFLFQLINSLS